MAVWEDGWQRVFAAIRPLGEADLARTVTIRGEARSVMQAIDRQISHYAYHTGQNRHAGHALPKPCLAQPEHPEEEIGRLLAARATR